jgi:hypothetical protein
MKAKWKDLWIRALRGGKFKQGRCALRSLNDKYCCLGVLCDLVASHSWERTEGMYTHKNNTWIPALSVLKTVGLPPPQINILVIMNDGKKRSFKSIANYIEKHL